MGPSNTITCADASSHLAIGEAFRTIQRGKADLAICGGAESRLNPMGLFRQELIGRLNESHNDSPEDALRPFDTGAKGTVFGEGGGLFVLEEFEHAKRRGAKVYAELVGFSASQDTHSVIEPDPTGHSYGKAIENALKDARLSVKDVDVLVPNGQGVAAWDRAELNGLRKALGDDLSRIALAPIKGQIGCLGAGCGADAAATVMAIHTGRIPPAVNTRNVIDGLKLNISRDAREAKVSVSVSSIYSQGGQNAALVFRRV
jgi:3-oxoacyl-[acyl-carrier-protein] synthase II